MTSNFPTSGSEDPIPGLARTVKKLAGSNVQTISCYLVLDPTLWYANFQSPEKYAWAMIAPIRGSTSCCPLVTEGSSQPLAKC